jgi:Na+/H+-dicarboxylate symporter/ABC-type amino acid transport substrate-binding protein
LVLWGLLLGLGFGLFFGEHCRPLKVVGDAFIKLLQVTVLPYVTVSLIHGIGSLTGSEAKNLARKAGTLLLVFWAVTLLMVALVPLCFPRWQSAAFFSASLVESPSAPDFVDLYIPSNPFRSLADNVVPAVVLFSILVGIALMGVKEKSGLMHTLGVATEALSRVTGLIVRLMPVGLFAIVAAAAGSMSLQEFGRLHVFLVAYVVAALFLTFWVLPRLVTLTTPFRYRDVVGLSRDVLVTAMVTANLLVVLPALTQRVKDLFRERELERDSTKSYADVIVPVAFNFPNLGEVLQLLFVLFAAWFSGAAVALHQYPGVLMTGLLSAFGSMNVGIPYLLDLLELPADLFQLYLIATLVTTWFATLLAAMGLLVFALLSVSILTGVATFDRGRLVRFAGLTTLMLVALVGGLRAYFDAFVQNSFTMAEVVGQMHLVREPLPATIHVTPPPAPPHTPGRARLDEIRERGYLRVGYLEDRLPHAFVNSRGELVGFDVELAHHLARTLGVVLEFVPLDRDQLVEQVNAGLCDIVMSALAATPDRASKLSLSKSYRDETVALLVPSHRRKEFGSLAAVRERAGLRLGYVGDPYFRAQLAESMPRAVVVDLDSPKEFFEGTRPGLDAFLYTAESGSAWTLLYPAYAVVVPHPGLRSIPLAFAMPRGETEMVDYVDAWIELVQKSGTLQQVYDYWILGRGAVQRAPRWSVLRNLLGWGS